MLPPSLREWLPEGHLAWFVLDAVDELDLSAFSVDYHPLWVGACGARAVDAGRGLYAYAIGERSSRAVERRCSEDIAFRVICANRNVNRFPLFADFCAPGVTEP